MALARQRRSSCGASICLLVLASFSFRASFLVQPCFRRAQQRSLISHAAYESGKINLGVEVGDGEAVVPAPLLEVNEATNLAIQDCLEDGCSVEALMALDEKVARDEKRVQETMDKLNGVQKTAFSDDNAETLAWYTNFLNRSGSLRAQLQALRGLQDIDFVKQLVKAASVAFGGGRSTDYPKVGVSPYTA
eukprot:CAMPEP_0172664728 /NCGR_PEP_ID=MMETSP1074-20121228/6797_1 /TAXON_ID=2916 /ORGANISM="Ceratium fusus, Strain PA161109" /LENGTH=190 /DNA_ID=CAMNT_0013480935 /DNA_START=64 /DNA_END=636 /DNA_ORIENTATION=+